MARSFLVPINLNSLELQNFIVHNVSSDPTGVAGRLYYNTSSNLLKVYNGTSWLTLATGGSTFTLGNTSVAIGGTTTSVGNLTLTGTSSWEGTDIAVIHGGTGTSTGSITGTGALTFTAGGTNQNVNLRPTGTGSVDLGSTNGTDGFRLTGLKDPSSDYDATNKKYVDNVAAGLNAHPAVNYATTGALGTTGNLVGGTITTTYANGTSGNGATITVATSSNWTAITIDGQSLTVNDRVLIKNQGGTASNLQNGIYTVTQVGAVGNTTSFIFTRAVDSNSTPEVAPGDTTYVLAGTNNGGNGFVQTATIVAIGTTAIAWSQFSGSSSTVAGLGLAPNGTNPNEIDVQVGTGISINGSNQVALANTAVTANSYGSATAVGTFTVDAQGRLTAAATTSIAGLNASVISAGTLTVGVGGTGAGSFTSGGILRGNGTSALSVASAADIVAAIGSTAVANATSATSATSATTATNATNTAITDDTTTNATMYPTWVTTTTGNLPQKISSTKLSFNPSTGTLATSALVASTVTAPTATTLTLATLATNATSTNSQAVTLSSGNAAGTTSSSGNVTVDAGTATSTAGTVSVGTANASGVAIGRTAITTNILGTFTVNGRRLNLSGDLTTSGAFNTTFAQGATVTLTLPTANGTLATLAGSEALTNKTYNNLTITPPATGAALAIASLKTFTVSNTLTLAGTDSTTMTFPGTSATIARTDAGQTFTGVNTFTSPSITTSLTTGSSSFDLVNTTATTINFAGAATTLNIISPTSVNSTINLGTGGGGSGQTKTINIGTGGTTGHSTTVNIATSTAGMTQNVNIGGASANIITITGDVRIPSVGTSGFVKLGANGSLSQDTNTYLTSSTGVSAIAGTTNQITASGSTGSVTLSLPSAVTIGGAMTAGSFVKSSGTSSQFLKADGSVDSSTYLTSTTGVTTVNGSSGAIGATANSNGAITRYYRATNSAGTSTVINHALGQWVLVQVYKTSDGTIADTDITNTSTSGGTTTVGFAASQTAGDYTIVIIG